jgi:hypothetical protein
VNTLRRRLVEGAACLCALGALWMLREVWSYRRAVPGPDETFESFAASRPEPEQLVLRRQGRLEALTWVARPGFLVLWPKGPPAYVFSRRGELLDWDYDSGPPEHRLHEPARRPGARRLSLDEARAWMKGADAQEPPPGDSP